MEFGDSVSEAPEVTARTVQPLHAAEAETKVRMVHLDRAGAQAKAEVSPGSGTRTATPPPTADARP